jgi:hypothetical protein
LLAYTHLVVLTCEQGTEASTDVWFGSRKKMGRKLDSEKAIKKAKKRGKINTRKISIAIKNQLNFTTFGNNATTFTIYCKF